MSATSEVEASADRTQQQRRPRIQIYSTPNDEISGFWGEKYERDAKKYWDIFYKRHQDRINKRVLWDTRSHAIERVLKSCNRASPLVVVTRLHLRSVAFVLFSQYLEPRCFIIYRGAALPTNSPSIPCIFDPHGRAGICGDWLLGSSSLCWFIISYDQKKSMWS